MTGGGTDKFSIGLLKHIPAMIGFRHIGMKSLLQAHGCFITLIGVNLYGIRYLIALLKNMVILQE
ncbi:MAG TPA: hypothetical protein DDZ99_03915 [Clostridiales bacterium]|nr:hypothetical protein [Clostridiales bacterium]